MGSAGHTYPRAFLANEASVVIVSVKGLAPGVVGVEPSVFRCVTGKAVAVGVAGHAIVGAVLAEGSGLPLNHQREQAFLETGVVSTQIIPLGAAGAKGSSLAGGALKRTTYACGRAVIEISCDCDASCGIGIKYSMISRIITR